MSKTTYAVEANEPLVPGRFYQVPCVRYPWDGRIDWWPVLGPRHTDKAFIGFDREHFHIDGRFLGVRQRRWVDRRCWRGLAYMLGNAPLDDRNAGPQPVPEMRRRKCWTASIGYVFYDREPIIKMGKHFAGHQCRMSDQGWLCPHQATPLGSILPIDGVITCPLHGLRIDAKTGVVMPARDACKEAG